jgi:hypothetical protein
MVILDATTKILELVTSAAVNTDYYVSYVDITTSAFTPGESDGQITTATTTTILAAPAASTQRQVKYLTVVNRSTSTAQTVSINLDVSGTERKVTPSITLAPGEMLQYSGANGLQVFTANGLQKVTSALTAGYVGQNAHMYKIGAASEAASINHSLALSSGFPGAWVPGSPGLAGRTCTGTDTADYGCLTIKNATTGRNFLQAFSAVSTTAHSHYMYDFLWVNSGLVVTTTTAQTVNSVTLPARDVNGSTNGAGVGAGILVATATTNASAITNTTMSYTNSEGTAGRTATISSFPATAAAGTFVPFQLAAGDRGIRSIQSITLGTSYGAGAIHAVMYGLVVSAAATSATAVAANVTFPDPGLYLPNGVCLLPIYMASTTGATTAYFNAVIMERP